MNLSQLLYNQEDIKDISSYIKSVDGQSIILKREDDLIKSDLVVSLTKEMNELISLAASGQRFSPEFNIFESRENLSYDESERINGLHPTKAFLACKFYKIEKTDNPKIFENLGCISGLEILPELMRWNRFKKVNGKLRGLGLRQEKIDKMKPGYTYFSMSELCNCGCSPCFSRYVCIVKEKNDFIIPFFIYNCSPSTRIELNIQNILTNEEETANFYNDPKDPHEPPGEEEETWGNGYSMDYKNSFIMDNEAYLTNQVMEFESLNSL